MSFRINKPLACLVLAGVVLGATVGNAGASSIQELTEKRSEVELKRVELEIRELDAKIRELDGASMPPTIIIPPPNVASIPSAPAEAMLPIIPMPKDNMKLIAVYAVNGKTSARVLTTSGSIVTVTDGEKISGEWRVQKVEKDNITINNGSTTKTLYIQ